MDTTERLVIDLPSELVAKLRELVASGEFKSESQVLEAAFQAWHVDDDLDEHELEEVRAAVAEGIADVEAGRVFDAEEVFDELRARYEAMLPDRKR